MYQVIEKDWKLCHMLRLIIDLINEEAIAEDDLIEFSEDLRDTVKTRLEDLFGVL